MHAHYNIEPLVHPLQLDCTRATCIGIMNRCLNKIDHLN